MTHFWQVPIASPLHPGQWFFFRKYAMHKAQFIPQGAIKVDFIYFSLFNLLYWPSVTKIRR